MTTNTNMPTESYQEIQDMPTVYRQLQDIITSETDGIPVSCLETRYYEKFKRLLDYNSLGVETREDLLYQMCDEDKVVMYKHEETKDQYVMWAHWFGDLSYEEEEVEEEEEEIEDMPTEPSVVYQEIQHVFASLYRGIPWSCLPYLEKRYVQEFHRLLDYESLGLKDIQELIDKMLKEGTALLFKDPDRNISYVISADLVEYLQEDLKHNVEELLSRRGGEIRVSSFECDYEDEFKVKLNYLYYGLTGFDHLRRVLNLVEAGSGEKKVIKSSKYNLRKRKNWMK